MADQAVLDKIDDLSNRDKDKQALKLVSKALKKTPDDVELLRRRVGIANYLDEMDIVDADVDHLLRLEPETAEFWVWKAQLAQDGDAALAALDEAVARLPQAPELAECRAQVLADHFSADAAFAFLDEEKGRRPGWAGLWDTAAKLRASRGKFPPDGDDGEAPPAHELVERDFGMKLWRPELARAVAELSKAIALEPNAKRLLRRANLYMDLRLQAEAQADLVTARDLAGEDELGLIELLEERLSDQAAGGAQKRIMQQIVERSTEEAMASESQVDHNVQLISEAMSEFIAKGGTMEQAGEIFFSGDPQDEVALLVAKDIVNLARQTLQEFEPIDVKTMVPAIRRQALRLTKELAPQGFSVLADYDLPVLHRMQGRKVQMRVLTHADGTTVATSVVRPKWPGILGFVLMLFKGLWKDRRHIEMSTRLSDGRLLLTDTSLGLSPFTCGGLINFEKLPPDSSGTAVLARHRERVAAALDGGSAQVVPIRTHEDYLAAAQYEHELRQAYREQVGVITDEELHGLLQGQYDALAGRVRKFIRVLTAPSIDSGFSADDPPDGNGGESTFIPYHPLATDIA